MLKFFSLDKSDDSQIKTVFFIVYVIGCLVTVFSSFFSQNYIPMAILCVLMVAYFFVVYQLNIKNNLLLRNEQLGDSFYYLGFLFTITALAVSLISMNADEEIKINSLLKNFGIAIVTTLFGLVGRILFSQFRENLDDMNERAEMEVAQSVRNLKTQLDMSISLLKQQSQTIANNTDQTLKDSSASLRRFMEENNKILQETTEKSKAVIEEFNKRASSISDKLSEVNIPTDKFKDFENSVSNIVTTLDNLDKGLKDSNAQEEIAKAADSFKSLSSSISQQSQLLNSEFKDTKDTLQALSKNLVDVAKFISTNLKK
jgi:soluble cytochrome b562